MEENAHLENDRTENVDHVKSQNHKCTTKKIAENTNNGKWQKMHTLKITEKIT